MQLKSEELAQSLMFEVNKLKSVQSVGTSSKEETLLPTWPAVTSSTDFAL